MLFHLEEKRKNLDIIHFKTMPFFYKKKNGMPAVFINPSKNAAISIFFRIIFFRQFLKMKSF